MAKHTKIFRLPFSFSCPSSYKLGPYYHTLKYLRLVQVTNRIWRKIYKPKPDLRPGPKMVEPLVGKWVQPALRSQSLVEERVFRHLHKEHELPEGGLWEVGEASRLWNYHLHYFDDLVAIGWEERRMWHQDLIRDWIRNNPPGQGTGWEPYPLSRRVVNWIKAGLTRPFLCVEAEQSLVVQARFLMKSLEHHLQGNHLWQNGKALVFAGCYFGGLRDSGIEELRDLGQTRGNPEEAVRWLRKGLMLVDRELREQVCSDGSHYEQSPMYHALMFEDVLDLINLLRSYGLEESGEWRQKAEIMYGYLQGVCHPDGQICLFNDAGMNMAPGIRELFTYAQRLGIEPVVRARSGKGWYYFPDSGLVRVEKGDICLFMDAGPIGPDHIPGHAHADNLTLEMSYQGQRLLVDTGTSHYTLDEERLRQRGTAAHNTVRVDGLNSSEVWSGFRVARRARPTNTTEIGQEGESIWVRAGHDGYARLPGKVLHHRSLHLKAQELEVLDELGGEGKHKVELFWHFHLEVSLVREKGCVEMRRDGEKIGSVGIHGVETVEIQDSVYCPEFGKRMKNQRIRAVRKGELPVRVKTVFEFVDHEIERAKRKETRE